MNRELTLEQMKRMSSDEIINAYRNGYRLSDCGVCGSNIVVLNPATCPTSIIQGTTKTLTIAVTTAGTKPYTLKFYVDGVLKAVTATWDDVNNKFTWSYTFSETVASHAYAAEIVDSCATGAKTSNRDTCTIAIVAPCATPAVTLTIPA